MYPIRLPRRCAAVLVALVMLPMLSASDAYAQKSALPSDAKPWPQLSSKGLSAHVLGKTLWLQLDAELVKTKKAVIPRVNAPLRSIRWMDQSESELKFLPEPQEWVFSWKTIPATTAIIEVVFDTAPMLPSDCPAAVPAGDDSVMLHAYQAATFGEKLRFEPQWYKNTVGYWAVKDDYATWDLTINQPGNYSVAVLQGCGRGQGGSEALMTLRNDSRVHVELPFQTIDTGHFQNFRWNHLGMINVTESGKYELRIEAKRIAKVALFDVRAIHLVRQAKPMTATGE